MNTVALDVEYREKSSKGALKQLRRDGFVPAIVYGDKGTQLPISVELRNLLKLYQGNPLGKNALIELNISKDGKSEKYTVISHDFAREPITKTLTHVDFLQITDGKLVTVEVPVALSGIAKGKKLGGIQIQDAFTIKLSCPPANIPERVDIDMTPVDIGESIRVGKIEIGENIKVITDPNSIAAHVQAPKAEKIAVDEDAEAGEGDAASTEESGAAEASAE